MNLNFEPADIDALADAVITKLKAEGLVFVGAPAAEAPAPTKPATKATKAADKPKTEAKAPEGAGPTREDVHAALRTYSGPKEAADYEKRKDAALAVLHKYSPTLATLKAEDYPAVIQKIADLDKAAPAAEADEDPF